MAPEFPCIPAWARVRASVRPVPFLSQERGLGSGLFWAEILGFALDEAIQMALTCEAAKNPR